MVSRLIKKCHANPTQAANAGVHYRISHTIDEFTEEWDSLPGHILMNAVYLKAIEAAPPEGMDFMYILAVKEQSVVARSVFQILHFNAARSLHLQSDNRESDLSFFDILRKSIKETVARKIDFYTLVQGNLLLTGPFHTEYHQEVKVEERFGLLSVIQARAREASSARFKSEIPVFLTKEYSPSNRIPDRILKTEQLHEFTIQPNMIVPISAGWNTYEDYLYSMFSKYRVREGRSRRKLESISLKKMDLNDIKKYGTSLHALYLQVANQSGFNMVSLHTGYFYSVKKMLGENYQIMAYFDNDQIVGFFTYFLTDGELLAHHVGFDKNKNARHQLYLNMLYQMVDIAIQRKKQVVNLGRTALEIKSSIGAIPEEMYCYIRHSNRLYQKMVPKLLNYLSPKEEWVQRHPFKY